VSSTALVPSLVRPHNRVVSLVADAVLIALGVTLIAIGQRVAGEVPGVQVSQPDGDCA